MNSSSTDWVPSHVQITTSSELYVSVQTDKEKFLTSLVSRSTTPEWKFTTEIPLMSLDTTLHITVRQKGRLSDDFIGYFPIPLGGFNLNSKQITHWYKLGSKPGKPNLKLRGDLLVTIQLLSHWVQFTDTYTTVSAGSRKIYPITGKVMLKRSKSDIKIKTPESPNLSNGGPLMEKTNNHSSKMKEKMSVFRRSFRKKNRSPVLQDCDEDFTSFSPPTHPRGRSHTIDAGSMAPSLLQNASGTSLSEISSSDSETGLPEKGLSQSPLARPSAQPLFAEAAVLEDERHGSESVEGIDSKMSPADRFYSFRSKKKRWTMQTLPLPTPSPAGTPTDPTCVDTEQKLTSPDSQEVDTYVAKSNSIAHSPMFPRSRAKSYCMSDSQQSMRSLLDAETTSESCSEANTPGYSPQMSRKVTSREPESGYNTSSSVQNRVKQSSISEQVSESTKKDDKKSVKGTHPQKKLAVTKTNSPPGRKTVTSPSSRSKQPVSRKGNASPTPKSPSSSRPTRPRVLSTTGQPIKRTEIKSRTTRPSSSCATPNRSPSLSRTPSGSRPLSNSKGSRSVRVRDKTPLSRRPKSMIETSSKLHVMSEPKAVETVTVNNSKVEPCIDVESNDPEEIVDIRKVTPIVDTVRSIREASCESENSSVTLLAPANESLSSKPSESSPTSNIESTDKVENEQTVENQQTENFKDSVSSGDHEVSKERSESPSSEQSSSGTLDDKKPKHTVAYSEASPLFKDGFRPVSLLPPSLMDNQSQTLPSRGKVSRYASDNNFVSDTLSIDRPSSASNSRETLTPTRRRQSNRSPENIRLIHRRSMNFSLLSAFNQSGLNSIPQSPTDQTSSLSDNMTDGDFRDERTMSRLSTATTISYDSDSRPSTPSTPSSIKYGGKTPGEIVTNALRNRKTSGGLRKAINMYQENRKQRREGTTSPQKRQDGLQVEVECLDRSSSADNSPQLRRNRSAAATFSIRNPFNSLRRTKSHTSPSIGRHSSISDFSTVDAGSLPDLQPPQLRVPSNSLMSIDHTQGSSSEKLSVSPPLVEEAMTVRDVPQNTISEKVTDSPSHSQREDTPTLTDTSSVKTLTEAECNHSMVRRMSSPNPAGAVTGGNHKRHTTCSSIGSEGFGSCTSEELSLEELSRQDLSDHWTKEELVKELIHSKQRLKNTEEELKDVKNYLDNLLLRIMETNPAILSSIPTP